jgi:hypothetical protein
VDWADYRVSPPSEQFAELWGAAETDGEPEALAQREAHRTGWTTPLSPPHSPGWHDVDRQLSRSRDSTAALPVSGKGRRSSLVSEARVELARPCGH